MNNGEQFFNTAAGGGYAIQRSLRFNAADSAYLSRTPASAGNRKTWTWAGWVKRTAADTNATIFDATLSGAYRRTSLVLYNGDLAFYAESSPSTTALSVASVAKYRDPSAWYHVVFVLDTTQTIAADRTKIYVNGNQIQLTYATSPSLNAEFSINAASEHNIGRIPAAAGLEQLSAYLADIHFIDGQALDPTSFGEFSATTGVWMPKAYTGSYGTNGFRLTFADNSAATATTLGKDAAGSNNWTPNNLSVTAGAGNDSLVDVPTNGTETDTGVGGEVRGNYATLNPLDKTPSYGTLSNGNLDWVYTGQVVYAGSRSTIGVSTGKWYFECTANGTPSAGFTYIGVATKGFNFDDSTNILITGNSTRYYRSDGNKSTSNGSQTTASYGASYTTGDVIGVALDMDAGSITFYKNGSSQGTAYSDLSGTYFACGSSINNSGGLIWNFGQRPFAYPLSGFKALNTANLPAPLVTKPSTVMDVALYTGNGSARSITGLGFSPDMVWIKSRSASGNHRITDIVRGATKELSPDLTNAEGTDANGVTAFNSDGFSLGISIFQNGSGTTYAGWCWDAGSSTVTNTQGSISSQVRANASAGFSVVTYTGNGTNGATVGHGLGVKPSLIITKDRTSSGTTWITYHTSIGATKYLDLNSTNAATTSINAWNNTEPTSSVFSIALGTGGQGPFGSDSFLAYCFAPVAGYSSFGSYTGNGSTDGPFIFTGFRPRWILHKSTTSESFSSWHIYDTARDNYNPVDLELYPNLSNAEGNVPGGDFDILSNGFKVRTNFSGGWNTNGITYIYAAFAEHPFQYARAR
jgi:hypothetical protein